MNILQVINSASPLGGGPIESILQAARAVAEHGHTMEIVSVDDPSAPWLESMPVRVHALGPARTPYRYSGQLVPWLREHADDYDCAVVNGIWLYPSYAVWRVLARRRIPYFVYAHGLLDPSHHRTFPVRRLKKMVSWVATERRVLDDAAAVLFTCEEERRGAEQAFWPPRARDNGAILPYCIGAPPGDIARQTEAFLARYPELRDRRRLLFLSRVHPKKGLDLLIRAFAAQADRDETLHLVVAGTGDPAYVASLQALAQSLGIERRMTWTGMLTGDLKWGAFRTAEAFLLPSHHENYGIAVVEALACGTPVVISSAINIWPEIEADGAGLTCDDNAASAATALGRWLDLDPAARLGMRDRAAACFATRFSAEQACRQFLDLLRASGVGDRPRPSRTIAAT